MKVKPFLILLLLAGCVAPAADEPRSEELFAPGAEDHVSRIETGIVADDTTWTLAERMSDLGIPAVSIAVFENGSISWAKAWGMADREEVRPAATSTLFQAASISKPVAAAAMLSMTEDGLLDLDADVNTYLTDWRLPENEFTATEKVTLRRLVNHTAGTTVWGFPGYARTDTIPTTVGVLDGEGNTDPVRVYKVPGESWQYSGGGYTVMQLVLENVSGRAFPDVVRDRVLAPAGMTASSYAQPLPPSRYAEAATGYREGGEPVEGQWHVYPEMAAAGLWTTPSDLARFAIAVQNDLAGAGTMLDSTTVREMLTPGLENHGLGPVISPDGLLFRHGGSNEGFRCVLVAFIDGRGGAAIMTNSDTGGELLGELLGTIAREYGWQDR